MEAKKQRVHFIAIGESVMHNLALALHQQGYQITGSDDQIVEPNQSRLQKAGLLPPQTGWFPEKITADIDFVILGTYALPDNTELVRARELGIRIYSYPEFIYEHSRDKQRIVITGSPGKTTITSIILHVLRSYGRKFDYVVSAYSEGFEQMISLSEDAPVIIIEGDEYPSSSLDRTPAFIHYRHHIGLISVIAWDHINVYPTFDEYVRQFELFADNSPKCGILVFSEKDIMATVIGRKEREDVQRVEYGTHKHEIVNGQTFLLNGDVRIPVHIFGKINMRNISGAKAICTRIGISEDMFFQAIQSFKGPVDRLEILEKNNDLTIYKDFAQAPSRLKAVTKAVKTQFPTRELVAVFELHTLSSLSRDFLDQYKETFKHADEPIVFFDPHTVENKKLPPVREEDVKKGFDNPKLKVFTDGGQLKDFLADKTWKNKNLLLMGSENFGGINIKELAKSIVGK